MEFEIEYDVILENGQVIRYKEDGTNIIISDCEFSFTRLVDGFRLTYYTDSVQEHKELKVLRILKLHLFSFFLM